MPRKTALFSWLLSIVMFSGSAAAAEVHEYILDNGLQLFVKEDHRAPVVVSQIWYGVGSSYEHDGITGVSHALEHMMYQGTEKYPAGQFSRIISANGGEENAFTGMDYTGYYQKLEASRLEISFELEADRMRNLTLLDKEFEKEIEVVKEERRMRTEDNPKSFTYEVAMATAFQTSPYQRPIVGWMNDLENMHVEQLREWYQRWYAPNNARVIVVGDVDPDAVYELAKKHFGSIPMSVFEPPREPPEVEQLGVKRVTVKRPAELPYLMMNYKVPVLKAAMQEGADTVPEWEPYALEVLVGILDGGDSARFARELVRDSRVAASAGASYNLSARLPTSVLTLSGTPTQDHTVADLEAAFREQIEKLKSEPVSADELERVKNQVVASAVYERDSVFYQAMLIGMLETVGLDWRVIDEYVDKVQAVTAEQVQAVAKKYLNDTGLSVAELEPQPGAKAPQAPVPTTPEGGADVVH